MRLIDLDNTSIKFYITESLRNDPGYTQHWNRLDEGFFKPWQQHLKLVEAQLTADQVQQIFAAAEKEQSATGSNSTMLGKIVEKIIPDSMVKKLSDSLPEPDPNAEPDPQFQQKATKAVNALPVDDQTKSGLMQIVKNTASNPAVQPVILSLVGGVLGGLVQKVGPQLSAFGLPGTVIAGVSGAVVAGGVAVALAKIQGKSWKDAFKGAIKPALAGAAGAVLGKMAADFVGSIGSGGSGQPAAGSPEMQKALDSDENMMRRLTNRFPPDEGFTYQSDGGDKIRIVDADGNAVFTGGIKPQTMDTKTFADLANSGQTVQQQTNVGTGNQIGSGSAALDNFAGGPGKYDQMQTMLSTQEKAAIAQDVAKQMGVPAQDVKFQGNTPVSVGGQPVPANIQQAYSDPTGMGAASDYKPVDTGSLRQGGAPGGVAFPGDPGYVPPDEAGKIKPVWRNKTRMPQGVSDSREYHGQRLSEGQVYMIFNRVVTRNDRLLTEGWLVEGPMDWIKKTAKNLTTKVTADKLNTAWKKAGSPMDSEAVAKVLADAGVNPDVTKKVYADLKISAAPAAEVIDIATVKQMMAKLSVDRRAALLTYLLGDKPPANKPAADVDDNPNIVRGTESLQRQGKKL